MGAGVRVVNRCLSDKPLDQPRRDCPPPEESMGGFSGAPDCVTGSRQLLRNLKTGLWIIIVRLSQPGNVAGGRVPLADREPVKSISFVFDREQVHIRALGRIVEAKHRHVNG